MATPWLPCPCCLRKLVASRAVLSARALFLGLRKFCARHDGTERRFKDEIALLDARLAHLAMHEALEDP